MLNESTAVQTQNSQCGEFYLVIYLLLNDYILSALPKPRILIFYFLLKRYSSGYGSNTNSKAVIVSHFLSSTLYITQENEQKYCKGRF